MRAIVLSLLLATSVLAAQTFAESDRPNILLIMGDDMGLSSAEGTCKVAE